SFPGRGGHPRTELGTVSDCERNRSERRCSPVSEVSTQRTAATPCGFRARLQTRTPALFPPHDRLLPASGRRVGIARGLYRGPCFGRSRRSKSHEAPIARSSSSGLAELRFFRGCSDKPEEVAVERRLRRNRERSGGGIWRHSEESGRTRQRSHAWTSM